MYSREKLMIKGRASRRVFPPKNALQSKSLDLYSPGEFTGRGSETHLHKRKAEILRFRAKRELSSNLPPKRKNRPEVRSAENWKMVGAARFELATFCSQSRRATNCAMPRQKQYKIILFSKKKSIWFVFLMYFFAAVVENLWILGSVRNFAHICSELIAPLP